MLLLTLAYFPLELSRKFMPNGFKNLLHHIKILSYNPSSNILESNNTIRTQELLAKLYET